MSDPSSEADSIDLTSLEELPTSETKFGIFTLTYEIPFSSDGTSSLLALRNPIESGIYRKLRASLNPLHENSTQSVKPARVQIHHRGILLINYNSIFPNVGVIVDGRRRN